MLILIGELNGQKIKIPVTADTGTGAPVGSYLYLEKKSNPQGYLYCNGSTFDETVYPALYQYLGTNVLPDWREFSPVGAEQNTTSSVIATHDVYTQGQEKDDQIQEHKHSVILDNQPNPNKVQGLSWTANNNAKKYGSAFIDTAADARIGDVTRGKSKAAFIYIKATSGLTENQQENVLNTINENNSYSTTEQPTGAKWIDGKPIYRKVIDCGALPNNTTKTVNHNISNLGKVIRLYGFANNAAGTDFITLPFVDTANSATFNTSLRATDTQITLSSANNMASFSGYAVIEYTKTTD